MSVQLVSLTQMQNTLRRMTARYVEAQMSTSQINYYLNLFMTLQLPLNFKNLKLTKPYVFLTKPNIDTYSFIYENNPTDPVLGGQVNASPGNVMLTPPVFCQGYLVNFYQDKGEFYNRWRNLSVNQIIGTGTGNANSLYTGTIPSTPFYRAQQDIFNNVTEAGVIISAYDASGFSYSVTDVPQNTSATPNIGLLFEDNGSQVGTVNYVTGAYAFTPANAIAIPTDANIYAAVVPYQSSRPVDVLFYNQQITFRPCPQQIYQVEFQISQQPLQMVANNSAPELDEWYLFICAGAAKLIYSDFPDPEGMAYIEPIWQEQLQISQRRTLKQLSTQRVQTIFTQPNWNKSSYFYGTAYSGN